MLKVKLSALALVLLAGAGNAQAQGISGVEYQQLQSTMICMAYTEETGLNRGIPQEEAAKIADKAILRFKGTYAKLHDYPEGTYNPSPEGLALDFAGFYHNGVSEALYHIEQEAASEGVRDYSPDHERLAVKLWNRENCALLAE